MPRARRPPTLRAFVQNSADLLVANATSRLLALGDALRCHINRRSTRKPTSSAPRGEATMVLKTAARKTTAAKKAPAKKTAAKKTTAKKTAAKKAPAKKTAAKKLRRRRRRQEGYRPRRRQPRRPRPRRPRPRRLRRRRLQPRRLRPRRPRPASNGVAHAVVSAAAAVPTPRTPATTRASATVDRRTGRRSIASCGCGRRSRWRSRQRPDRVRHR